MSQGREGVGAGEGVEGSLSDATKPVSLLESPDLDKPFLSTLVSKHTYLRHHTGLQSMQGSMTSHRKPREQSARHQYIPYPGRPPCTLRPAGERRPSPTNTIVLLFAGAKIVNNWKYLFDADRRNYFFPVVVTTPSYSGWLLCHEKFKSEILTMCRLLERDSHFG